MTQTLEREAPPRERLALLSPEEYVELHRHCHYSGYDGYGKPKMGALFAKANGQVACGLTDHGVMTGQVEHWMACQEAGITPICGVEGYYQPTFDKAASDYHMTVLVMNQVGWENLSCMLTEAGKESWYNGHARFTDALLEKYHEGLLMASGCVGGYIPQLLLAGEHEEARAKAESWKTLLGDRFYLEVMPFPVIEDGKQLPYLAGKNIQRYVNLTILWLARELDTKVIMTSDAHYISESEYETYLFVKEVSGKELRADYSNLFMHTAQGMEDAWEEMMDCAGDEYIKETRRLADRCSVNLKFENMVPIVDWGMASNVKLDAIVRESLQKMGKWEWSEDEEEVYFWLRGIALDKSFSAAERRVARKNMARLKKSAPYVMRYYKEYGVIEDTGFHDYFLMVWDVANWARARGIRCGARGSVCGSLIAYAMGITFVDPIIIGTYFERFMRKDKREMPDIDMDIESGGRAAVLAYVFEKYQGRAAHISNFGYYKVKNLINDMEKYYPEMEKGHATGLKGALEDIAYEEFPISYEELLAHPEKGSVFGRFDRMYPTFLLRFTKLFGQIKFVGMHAAGIMITNGPIQRYAPLMYIKKNEAFQASFDMWSVNAMGGMKLDLLGLSMWSIISDVEKWTGCSFSYDILEDPLLLKKFADGKTDAIFQFGGHGIRELLKKVAPKNFQELVAVNAMYRPGPLKSGLIDQYIAGKNGRIETSAPWYPLTTDTYGVIVYQEQAMYVCVTLAKMSWKHTDKMIKGISKKNIPPDIEKMFLEGLVEHAGMSMEQARKLYESVKKYSFNKNHSASYTQIAMYDMYLREKYKTEFWCAVLRHANDGPKGESKIEQMEVAALRDGQLILRPHMNAGWNYDLVQIEGENVICAGLRTMAGVGEATARLIVAQRGETPYTSLEDLKSRVPKRSLNSAREKVLVEQGGALVVFDQNCPDWPEYEKLTVRYCAEQLRYRR